MDSKPSGQFMVDAEGRSFWSANSSGGPATATKGGSELPSAQGSANSVEKYTGELSRDDMVPVKPVAAMSYGQRVRIARIYKGHEEFLDQHIKIAGWCKTCRAQKDCCFVEINDGSCFQSIQVVVASTSKDFEQISKTIAGASLSFKGTLIKSPAKGQLFELAVNDDPEHNAKLIGNSDGTYPIQGRPNLDTLRQQQHLRARTNTFGAVARVRNSLAYATHQFFQTRGFLYIHTPIITASDCEGAGEMFAVTTVLPSDHNAPITQAKLQTHLKVPKSEQELAEIAAKKAAEQEAADKANEGKKKKKDKKKKKAAEEEAPKDEDKFNFTPVPLEQQKIDYAQDMFGKPAFLSVSGQLNVETYAAGLSDCYTFGPTFRAENSHTSRHLCEFWMIEPEISFATLEDDMDCAEDYLKFCLKYVLTNNLPDMEFFEKRPGGEKGLIERLKNVIDTPFKRLEYTEAVNILLEHIKEKKAPKFSFEVFWGCDLASEHEKYLTDKVFKGPVVVYNYPKGIKAFYMKLNDDNKTVQAMDVLVPGIGEVIGGSAREDNLETLDRRIKEMDLEIEAYWWYRDLRKYGSVPHAGFGLGFERLVMMATGIENIKDVIPFPRAPGQAEF